MDGAGGFNTPKNLSHFAGKFVVFFSEDAEPKVLFSTLVAEEAYEKAEELFNREKRKPVVIRIQTNPQNNIAQVATTR